MFGVVVMGEGKVYVLREIHEFMNSDGDWKNHTLPTNPLLYVQHEAEILRVIEHTKPSHVFVEVDEIGLEKLRGYEPNGGKKRVMTGTIKVADAGIPVEADDSTDNAYVKIRGKNIIKTAMAVGAEIVPMEESYSLDLLQKLKFRQDFRNQEKLLLKQANVEEVAEYNRLEGFKRDLSKLKDMYDTESGMVELNGFEAFMEFMELGKKIRSQIGKAKDLPLETILKHGFRIADEGIKEVEEGSYETLDQYNMADAFFVLNGDAMKSIIYDDREGKWLHQIEKFYRADPDSNIVVILGNAHANRTSALLMGLNRKDIPYTVHYGDKHILKANLENKRRDAAKKSVAEGGPLPDGLGEKHSCSSKCSSGGCGGCSSKGEGCSTKDIKKSGCSSDGGETGGCGRSCGSCPSKGSCGKH